MDDIAQFDFPTDSPKIIKVIGVGGGGGNAVNHMYREGIHDVAFVVCNTDRKALEESPVPVKLQLGHEGLGAGNRPAKAKEATEESINEVQGMLNDGTKMVFITAGMGGGTGTGAAPTIARIAKEMDILTVGIVTIPFRWEGDKKIDQALDGVEEISKHVDALLVINNEKLGEIYPDLSVTSAFAKANDTLLIAAKSIAEIITMRGIINLDFNDVKTVMKDGGVAIMSTGYGEGESRVSEAIKNAQHSPLLNNNDIFNSKKVLLNISYSPDHELMMSEMDEIKDFMNRFNRDFETKFGMAEDPELEQKVKITLLATGFGIQDIHMKEMDDRITQRTAEEQKRLAELEEEEEQRRSRRETYYGKDANTKYQRLRRRHIYIFNPEDLDNADIISMVENSPTYQRDKSTLAAIKVKAEEAGILATEEAREAESGGNGIITFYAVPDFSRKQYIVNSKTIKNNMDLFERVSEDIKNAMRAKDKVALETLRNIKKVFLEAKTAPGANDTLTDADALKIIQKLTKQGKDAAEIYVQQGRQDLADAELAQVKVMEAYLPKQMSPEELEAALKEIIAETGATSGKDMGKVMGVASKKLAGLAEGRAISAKVKELLG